MRARITTNHYKFSALMSFQPRDNIQAKYTSTCSDSCTHVGPPMGKSSIVLTHLG